MDRDRDFVLFWLIALGVGVILVATSDSVSLRDKTFIIIVTGTGVATYYMHAMDVTKIIGPKGSSNGSSAASDEIRQPRKTKAQLREYMDPALWTLKRDPNGSGPLDHRHLDMRCQGRLTKRLRSLAKLGRKFGLADFVNRAIVVLETYFRLYHWIMIFGGTRAKLASSIAARNLQTLHDLRTSALNSMQDIVYRTPRAYDDTVNKTTRSVEVEVDACLRNVVDLVHRLGNNVDIARIQASGFAVERPIAFETKKGSHTLY